MRAVRVASTMKLCNFISHKHAFFAALEIYKMAESRKPNKLYATHPKGYGKGSRACRVTGRLGGMGLVRKYGINMKRQTFRERALDMGFEKYS
jgi:small subunit ribosomal protein S29e